MIFTIFPFLQVNQQVVLEVPCEGVPEPEMSWKLNDAEVTTNDNVKVKCAAGVAKLMFIPGKRYFLRFKKGMLDWARRFPADASSTSRADEEPTSSPLPWPMACRSWALAERSQRRPFVDTGRLVVIRRKLPSNRVTVDCGQAFLLV